MINRMKRRFGEGPVTLQQAEELVFDTVSIPLENAFRKMKKMFSGADPAVLRVVIVNGTLRPHLERIRVALAQQLNPGSDRLLFVVPSEGVAESLRSYIAGQPVPASVLSVPRAFPATGGGTRLVLGEVEANLFRAGYRFTVVQLIATRDVTVDATTVVDNRLNEALVIVLDLLLKAVPVRLPDMDQLHDAAELIAAKV